MAKFKANEIYEVAINYCNVDDIVSVTTYEGRQINQLKALSEKHPDEVKLIPTDLAGVVLAHIPKKYVHVSFYESSRGNMTDEQKAAAAERMRKAREKKVESKDELNE